MVRRHMDSVKYRYVMELLTIPKTAILSCSRLRVEILSIRIDKNALRISVGKCGVPFLNLFK